MAGPLGGGDSKMGLAWHEGAWHLCAQNRFLGGSIGAFT